MKNFKILKKISIIFSIIGLVMAIFGLSVGISSIDAEGLGQIGVIFIFPSIFLFVIVLFDFLIAINLIKIGLIFSYISIIIKIGVILLFIPSAIYDFRYQIQYGTSNLSFDLVVIILFILITIPSIFNIIKLTQKK